MTTMQWNSDPEILGPLDAAAVRCIAGDLTDRDAAASASVPVEVLRVRVAEMVGVDLRMTLVELDALPLGRRRRLAEEIVEKTESQREAALLDNVESIVPKHPHPHLTVVPNEEPGDEPTEPERA
ncbi:MAG: hypothetical protein ABI887_01170 [Burkholderiales bacterium]